MKNEIEISVITPSYNSEKYISQTIESVLDQTTTNWELIIIDDKSTDKSIETIEYFVGRDSRIKLISLNENVGAAAARNAGLRVAKGRYVAFLDADDFWYPEKITRQIEFMRRNKIDISHTLYSELVDDQIIKNSFSPSIQQYSDLLRANYVGCLTVVIDRELKGEFQFPNLKIRHDYALWLELSKKFDLILLPEILGVYRKDSLKSLSKNRLKVLVGLYLVYRHLRYNQFLSIIFLLRYIFYFVLKRRKYETISS